MSTLYTEHLKDKTKEQVLEEFGDRYVPAEQAFGTTAMTLSVKCVQDLEQALKSLEISMNRNADSNNKLSAQVFILNIILGIITIGGVLITLIGTIFTLLSYLGYGLGNIF